MQEPYPFVKECRNNGFTVDITKTEGMFSAHNEEGYQLYIYYYENKKEMHISIDSNDIEEKGFAEGTYESLKVKNFVFDISTENCFSISIVTLPYSDSGFGRSVVN